MVGRIAWGVLLAALGALEAAAFFSDGFPTLGDLLRFFLQPRGGRYVLFAGWLWLGWHFLIRYNPSLAHP